MLRKISLFNLTIRIILVLLFSKGMGLSLMKNRILRCWDCPFFLNWIRVCTVSIARTTSRKIASLILSMKFLFFWYFLFKSDLVWNNSCHAWCGAADFYLDILDKLQNEYNELLVLNLLFL